MQAAVVTALRKEKLDSSVSVFFGKGEMERSREEQMSVAFKEVCGLMNLNSKEDRQEAGLEVQWPNAAGEWFYAIKQAGRINEVLIAGQNDMDEVICRVYIWDDELYKAYVDAVNKVGKNKFLLQTVMMDVKSEAEMLGHKGKGKGKK